MGSKIEERKDGFIVEGPKRLHRASCESYGDHRIAGLSSGFHRLPLNLNNLKSGVYIIRMNVDKKEIRKKITIVE